jgi:hypothetical protein
MMPGVERRTIAWTLVAFFGASIVFSAIQDVTADEGLGITLLLEVLALAAMVALIVAVVRRRR